MKASSVKTLKLMFFFVRLGIYVYFIECALKSDNDAP